MGEYMLSQLKALGLGVGWREATESKKGHFMLA
jgi:hypothetical protein